MLRSSFSSASFSTLPEKNRVFEISGVWSDIQGKITVILATGRGRATAGRGSPSIRGLRSRGATVVLVVFLQ